MECIFLKKEIICSLCSAIYNDPVMLYCGHNFCSDCIKTHISKQGWSSIYSCPECKQMSKSKAPLNINTKLQRIAQNWKSVEKRYSLGEASCNYCLEDPTPAVKICLHCESSMCEKHLAAHSKNPEHSLADITCSMQNRICGIHGEILKFFCTGDKTPICMSCFLTGSHQGHMVELLEFASRHKREELLKVANQMHVELEALKRRGNALQEVISENKDKAEVVKGEIRSLCSGLLTYIRDVASKMEADISNQELEIFREILDEMASLQDKEQELIQEIKQVEDLCSKMDPILILQDTTQHKLRSKRLKTELRAIQSLPYAELDLLLISLKFKKNFEKFVKLVPTLLSTQCHHLKYQANVLLNSATASSYLVVSQNRKAAVYRTIKTGLKKPRPGQFKSSHVFSELAFSSGKHYWEVKTSKEGVKSIGVAYPSIKKEGPEAFLGYNKKSWCLTWSHGYMAACHNSQGWQISSDGATMSSVAVYLDYEGGLVSFYRTCSPVQHLFTFSTKFTEPLHAAFYVVNSWIKISP
ncbi:E3 ubiquitin/ISG15 ligase TRIM25-like [Leptodactylus fuscus]|uniref:E3 ubiquitin/ISG15 ligase TRIM25-like n=1 Tax=Leptodactylus fuscus TaxID=238119 RepID=UPI003F4EDA3C